MNWLNYLIILSIITGVGFLFSSNKIDDVKSPVLIPPIDQKNTETASLSNATTENNSYSPSTLQQFSDLYPVERTFLFSDDNDSFNREEVEEKRLRAEDLQSRTEDLNWGIDRMKRNTDSYDADEFSSKLKKLQWEAEDLSSEASDVGVDDAASSLDDAQYELRKLRNDIEDEPRYFYGESKDEIDSRLKHSSWDTEDASSYFDDFSSSFDD